MAARQKRVMVLVVLGTLAACAFFLAQGTTSLVAASVLEVDRSVDTSASGAARPVVSREKKDDTQILRRNIFDGVPLDGDPVEEVEVVVAETEEELVIDGLPPICDGSMRLVASVVNPLDAEWSRALIVGAAGKARVYRPGQGVDERQVVSVDVHSVVMSEGARPCRLVMFGEEEAAATPRARPAVAQAPERPERPARPTREGAISSDAMESGITRVNDTTYNIQRGLVDNVLENQQELLRAARVIPHEENGRVVGVKMYGIRRNSLLGRLGVQNGDMLRTINGYDMSSPDGALEAYTRLRNADHLTLNIVRRGQPTTLDYNIQ